MIPALVGYLAEFCLSGDFAQVEVIARSMLAAMPEDIIALQFLGLALYQMGRIDDAYRAFKRVAAEPEKTEEPHGGTDCEMASTATYRAATQGHSGLTDGWRRIALVQARLGFHKLSARAARIATEVTSRSGLPARDRQP